MPSAACAFSVDSIRRKSGLNGPGPTSGFVDRATDLFRGRALLPDHGRTRAFAHVLTTSIRRRRCTSSV